MLFLINYFCGTYKIKITGAYIERFFNICAQNNIRIWGIKKIDFGEINCTILASDYKILEKLIGNTKCQVSFLGKYGFFVLLNRFKQRYIFILGIILSFFLYFLLTNFIWQINIEGTDKTALVYDALKSQNIKIGTKISSISPTDSKNNILLNFDEFLWIALNIKGNSLNVVVSERAKIPQVVDKNVPCDIIAEKSGLIEKIDVLSGEKIVSVGQTFAKNDVLVSAKMQIYSNLETTDIRLVHSIADIKARIWYNFSAFLPLEISEKHYTGNQTKQYTLIFSNKAINLFKNSGNPYPFYDKIIETKEINLSDSVKVPIALKIETYTEYEKVPALLNEDFATNLLYKNLRENISKNINGDILEIKKTTENSEKLAKLSANVTTLENIGIKMER